MPNIDSFLIFYEIDVHSIQPYFIMDLVFFLVIIQGFKGNIVDLQNRTNTRIPMGLLQTAVKLGVKGYPYNRFFVLNLIGL